MQDPGPPGMGLATITLAILTVILGLPIADQYTAPFVYDMAVKNYGHDWAYAVRWIWFAALGVLIFSAARVGFFYAVMGAGTSAFMKAAPL